MPSLSEDNKDVSAASEAASAVEAAASEDRAKAKAIMQQQNQQEKRKRERPKKLVRHPAICSHLCYVHEKGPLCNYSNCQSAFSSVSFYLYFPQFFFSFGNFHA